MMRLTYAIETGVRFGQLGNLPSLLNREAPWPIRTLQILETVHRNAGSTGGELQ